MNDEQRELAKRLAAHPNWEWRQGMTAHIPGWGPAFMAEDDLGGPDDYPDLKDPCTQGLLWSMLREALDALDVGYDFSSLDIYVSGDVWSIQTGHMGYQFDGRGLGEACADGLLVVWGEP